MSTQNPFSICNFHAYRMVSHPSGFLRRFLRLPGPLLSLTIASSALGWKCFPTQEPGERPVGRRWSRRIGAEAQVSWWWGHDGQRWTLGTLLPQPNTGNNIIWYLVFGFHMITRGSMTTTSQCRYKCRGKRLHNLKIVKYRKNFRKM